MKALSVRGDYIMDMVEGTKTIEYRTWSTNYRGPILMCSTTKKVAGAAPGYAIMVAMITDITWSDFNECYEWHIEPIDKSKDSSYMIEPIHIKGQLKLFNVDDQLIKPINKKQWQKLVEPLIYRPKNIRIN